METFTKNQLNFINAIKKELGIDTVWHYLEYLRIEGELGHTPTLQELASNAGQTEVATWAKSIGAMRELGFITKKTRVQTVEEMMWKSEWLDLLWTVVTPHMDENGFGSIDNKGRAEAAVKSACDTKVKTCTDKADVIRECEAKTLEKINKIWEERVSDIQDYPFDQVPSMQMAG